MATEQANPATAFPQEVSPYFDAAAEGRLLVKRCTDCGQNHHYPRAICPHCGSDRTEWAQASGRAVIYSFAVAKQAAGGVHILAYFTLDDCRVTMLTNIVTDAPAELYVGAEVQIVFRAGLDGIVMPMFVPVVQP
ncbi:hypothetical protein SAMN05216344_10532 [Polaromonas sp. OV174]|uniref:Zn-ribbon domain-containing OB-fold protein n=1 Tax=Polaromonas sp. OV174 TaxID=1855300 RepID=UPI0008F05241|nr:zinc ribbon domain-containing protein [Polaromonas sp. OV174]SFB89768.1 hypothetical protein SAMN05216344_10532 [Polaromonas sp. OV174]